MLPFGALSSVTGTSARRLEIASEHVMSADRAVARAAETTSRNVDGPDGDRDHP
jgi:hypothetical protein